MFSEVDVKVIRGIRQAVDERGEDWRYPNGRFDGVFNTDPALGPYWVEGGMELRNFNPLWTNDRGECHNLLPTGEPACIIGACAVNAGLPTEHESSAGEDGRTWGVSGPVAVAMVSAQGAQDFGYTWGVAWERFVEALIDRGATQEQIDEALA